jgi:hypothetical protein
MTDVRSRRDGSWVVELAIPLQHAGKQLDELRLKPLSMGQLVRWNNEQIPSVMALMAELTDLPELLLRQITFPDVDRVMLVFASMMPPVIQQAMTNGSRPMATPDQLLPQGYTADTQVVDQSDPRFPHVDGPVRRFPAPPVVNLPPGQHAPPQSPPPPVPQPPQDTSHLAQPGDIMKAV